eukprot:TRINITY_DN40335_c0_g1_i1.p1 TRINITY_DN40335_c0_g1~~TRINITY_DN40335_c0_g1_i1.p1  ORF type:complete len:241 (+),score=21.07 TRINITY_DN40335_c0_g1_i1:76-798(+)
MSSSGSTSTTIKVLFPDSSVYCPALSGFSEEGLTSYVSVSPSLEASERASPGEYSGCHLEDSGQVLNAQQSEQRQRSVRKSTVKQQASRHASSTTRRSVFLLLLFPAPARLPGPLANFHPTLRSRNDMSVLALLQQSAADLRHYTMLAFGIAKSVRASWTDVPYGAKTLIAAYLAPVGVLLSLNRPSPMMWFEYCREIKPARLPERRARRLEQLLKVKTSTEENTCVVEIMFRCWRLSLH